MGELVFAVEDHETTATLCKCSRCNARTYDEEKMVRHVLEELCEKGARYYTREKVSIGNVA